MKELWELPIRCLPSPLIDVMKLAVPVVAGRSLETFMGTTLGNEVDSVTQRGDIAGSSLLKSTFLRYNEHKIKCTQYIYCFFLTFYFEIILDLRKSCRSTRSSHRPLPRSLTLPLLKGLQHPSLTCQCPPSNAITPLYIECDFT